MSFAENLKQLRKERGLSQEALAELLDVSRQAVSKWEQGEGYPEVEKLLYLAQTLNISLDALMSTGLSAAPTPQVTNSILITSPHENVIAPCHTIQVSQKMSKGKHAPQYALFTTDPNVPFGGRNIFLGWYANEDLLHKEITEIQTAIAKGIPAYTLQYSCKVKFRWGFPHIIE
jgi:DNA-binding XRE family transcriptional regulator